VKEIEPVESPRQPKRNPKRKSSTKQVTSGAPFTSSVRSASSLRTEPSVPVLQTNRCLSEPSSYFAYLHRVSSRTSAVRFVLASQNFWREPRSRCTPITNMSAPPKTCAVAISLLCCFKTVQAPRTNWTKIKISKLARPLEPDSAKGSKNHFTEVQTTAMPMSKAQNPVNVLKQDKAG